VLTQPFDDLAFDDLVPMPTGSRGAPPGIRDPLDDLIAGGAVLLIGFTLFRLAVKVLGENAQSSKDGLNAGSKRLRAAIEAGVSAWRGYGSESPGATA
jgi:hypothetical protein